VEVTLPGAPGQRPIPWIVSNPIYLREPGETGDSPLRPAPTRVAVQYGDGPAPGWRIEKSERSSAAMDVIRALGGTQLLMRYAIGGTMAEAPFAAYVMPPGEGLPGYDRLMFNAHADHPMRLSVQLRVAEGAEGERWQRSVYLDQMSRTVAIFFDDMHPVGTTGSRQPPLDRVESVLFVVDTVNTKPGTSGQIWIDDVKYGR
jgi:hypothetical protein